MLVDLYLVFFAGHFVGLAWLTCTQLLLSPSCSFVGVDDAFTVFGFCFDL